MEIEIKIPLTDTEYDKLSKDFLAQGAQFYKKDDTYYSRYEEKSNRTANKEPLIRIRHEESTSITPGGSHLRCISDVLTYKIKSTVDGIENNVERETEVDDVEVIKELFNKTGFKCWFTKNKSSIFLETKVDNISFNAEVEIVNGHKYIEIENVNSEADKDTILAAIKKFCLELELDYEKRDGRSWPTILAS